MENPPEFVWSRSELFTRNNEGCRLEAYQDLLGYWTIGWGHQGRQAGPGVVWTPREADAAFSVDYSGARFEVQKWLGYQFFYALTEARAAALVDMGFQLGAKRLGGFVKMLGALQKQDWAQAGNEARDSEWARQVPERAERVIGMIETGEWPGT